MIVRRLSKLNLSFMCNWNQSISYSILRSRLPQHRRSSSTSAGGNYESSSTRESIADQTNGPKKNRAVSNLSNGEDLFPIIRKMNVVTDGKEHVIRFNFSTVVSLIRLRLINPMVSLQYCHYLAYLCRESDSVEHREIYSNNAFNLMNFLLDQEEISRIRSLAINDLLVDISTTSAINLSKIVNEYLEKYQSLDDMKPKHVIKLLETCYKFERFDYATKLLRDPRAAKFRSVSFIDLFIEKLIELTEPFSNKDSIYEVKEMDAELKRNLLEHLHSIIEFCQTNRVQFLTDHPKKISKCLEALDLEVVVNPLIKLSCRCTNCNLKLPEPDEHMVERLNNEIGKKLFEKIKLNGNNLPVHAEHRDLEKFKNFIDTLSNQGSKPLDYVIDGLNIAYKGSRYDFVVEYQDGQKITSKRRHNKSVLAQVLVNTIIRNKFLNENKRILVLGRKHMTQWPGLESFLRENKIHYYFSSNESPDDLFQMYVATMYPKTLLITNDYFRENLAYFDGQVRIDLERWIDTHQTWCSSYTLIAVHPTPYDKIPSIDEKTKTFHLPVFDKEKLREHKSYDPPAHLNAKSLTWICCKPKKDVTKSCNQTQHHD